MHNQVIIRAFVLGLLSGCFVADAAWAGSPAPVQPNNPIPMMAPAVTPAPSAPPQATLPTAAQAVAATQASTAPTPAATEAESVEPIPAEEVEPELTPEEEQEAMRQEAFDNMMSGMLPLTPPELRSAFEKVDKNQKAIEEPLAYPKPEIAFTTVSLDPGAEPLTFKLATGHVTTVTFLDITGAPWPIKDISWAGNFEVKAPADVGEDPKYPTYPNLVRIVPLAEYAYGNMSVRLVGLNTPVTFTLRTNREVVQYRLDIRVPQAGPLGTPSLVQGEGNHGLTAGDDILMRVMEGVPPDGAQKLNVTGVDGRTTVYRLAGVTYVRTPLTLLSPGWNGSVKSADGMNVYALGLAPVLLLSDEGEMVRAQIDETKGTQ